MQFLDLAGVKRIKQYIDDSIVNFITSSVSNLTNYYLKSETYTKSEVEALIAAINQFHYEIAASTSAVSSPANNVLYLIGPTGTGEDKYEEYVYSSSNWVKIGDTSISLSGYVTTQMLNTALADYTNTTTLNTLLAGKQDVINDLSDIRTGSQNNVKYTAQTLTDAQKLQARTNIGASKGGTLLFTFPLAGVTEMTKQQWESTVCQLDDLIKAARGEYDTIGYNLNGIGSSFFSKVISKANELGTGGSYSLIFATGIDTYTKIDWSMIDGELDGNILISYHSINQQQADWSETDVDAPTYILNKPTIPAVPTNVVQYTAQSLTDAEKTQARTNIGAGTYSKPLGGIPATDLASAVQTSLGKADTALQSFTETDPTVPSWAKQSTKPSYTASEVGALPDTTVIPTVPTISINVASDKTSDAKTSSPKSVYSEIHPTVVDTQPSGGFVPNIFYRLGTITGSVTFSLVAPTDNTIENEYHWSFTAGNPAPTITWPSGIEWVGGESPTINAGQKYEISVLDNIAGNILEPVSSSGGGSSYTLPIASASGLGGIKVGSGLSIDSTTGVLSATGGATERILTIVGSNLPQNNEITEYTKSEFEQAFCSVNDFIAAARGEYDIIRLTYSGNFVDVKFNKYIDEFDGEPNDIVIYFDDDSIRQCFIEYMPLDEVGFAGASMYSFLQVAYIYNGLPDSSTSSADLKVKFEKVFSEDIIAISGGDGSMYYVPITKYIDNINGTNFDSCDFTYDGYNYSVKRNNDTDVYSCTKTPVPEIPTNVVKYSSQSLSDAEKTQARANIGAGTEDTSNKVTALSAQSTDTQYPSAKCVYDIVGNIETLLTSI